MWSTFMLASALLFAVAAGRPEATEDGCLELCLKKIPAGQTEDAEFVMDCGEQDRYEVHVCGVDCKDHCTSRECYSDSNNAAEKGIVWCPGPKILKEKKAERVKKDAEERKKKAEEEERERKKKESLSGEYIFLIVFCVLVLLGLIIGGTIYFCKMRAMVNADRNRVRNIATAPARPPPPDAVYPQGLSASGMTQASGEATTTGGATPTPNPGYPTQA